VSRIAMSRRASAKETAANDPSTDFGGEAFGEDWTPPEMLADRYRMEEEVGRGGMGVVYRAHDANLNIKIAVKLISGGTIERFRTEAQSIAALNHPSIVRVYEFNQQDGLSYIVMEHVEGESLLDRLRRDGTIPTEEAIRIITSLCDALSHAHGKGIIHRDIKPSNVLLSDEGVPKLVDFGLARRTSDDGQLTRGGLGTPAYVAPEQAKDGTLADARSDLWSLAASLYHMITGRIPRVIRLDDLATSIHKVLGKALEDRPDDRYQSAEELRTALSSVEGAEPGEVEDDPSETESTAEKRERNACPQCNSSNDRDDQFCQGCGAELKVKCPECERPVSIHAKNCGGCRTEIEALRQLLEMVKEMERLKHSNHWESLSQDRRSVPKKNRVPGDKGQAASKTVRALQELGQERVKEIEELHDRVNKPVTEANFRQIIETVNRLRHLGVDGEVLKRKQIEAAAEAKRFALAEAAAKTQEKEQERKEADTRKLARAMETNPESPWKKLINKHRKAISSWLIVLIWLGGILLVLRTGFFGVSEWWAKPGWDDPPVWPCLIQYMMWHTASVWTKQLSKWAK
jgi:serine/threonine protein kinase